MELMIAQTLAEYPILTLFVVIGLGYLIGEISVLGFKLGVAGVLFAGLAVGSLGADVGLPEIVPTLGQIIFVYTIGIQAGKAFFESFRSQGYRDNLLVAAVLLFGAVLTAVLAHTLSLKGPRAAGLFCGSLTSTPALAAARDLIRYNHGTREAAAEPVLAYSITYPIGVIGVLICFQLLRRLWRVRLEPQVEAPEITVRDFVVRNPGVIGRTIGEVLRLHKDYGFVISRIQQDGTTDIARSDTRLNAGDIVAVVGDDLSLERAQQIFGEPSETHIEADRSELDFRRVFVSNKAVVGKRIRDLQLQDLYSATITRLRRGDIDVVPAPDTRIEFGDRIRVLTRRSNFARIADFFGDSIKGTAEADFGSVALGMVLGVLLGMLPVPIAGTSIRLGLAGGPLLVALVLGKLERTGRITWLLPISANLTLRQIGLLLFLAGVGSRAGYGFAETIRTEGLRLIGAGAVVTFAATLATMYFGYKFLRMPYDYLMGVMSGLQTQTACLAFANNQVKSDAPDLGYASVYPAAMVIKIVAAQLLVAWMG